MLWTKAVRLGALCAVLLAPQSSSFVSPAGLVHNSHSSRSLIEKYKVNVALCERKSYNVSPEAELKSPSKTVDINKELKKAVSFMAILLYAAFFNFGGGSMLGMGPRSALAELTDEQKLVAQTWRVVDKLYLDRTFGGQDWFSLRQKALKGKYSSMDDAYNGISEMLTPIGDKYTRFLPPSQYKSLFGSAMGEVAGIGVEIYQDKDTGYTAIANVEPDSPALSGGLKDGDLIKIVSGEQTKGVSPDEVATFLRGFVGTKVGVTVERDGETLEFILTRAKVKIQGVKSFMSVDKEGKKVGVVKISSFSANTAENVQKGVTDLKKKGATAIVLDLRGNPGGLLPGGVDTARLFLKADSPVVYVVAKTGVVDAQRAVTDGPEVDTPLVLVVDDRTASAAEVLSAAIKENNRGKLVGQKTFGKGVIQTIEPLRSDTGVAVTIARYETPKRNNINKVGIPVDISTDCLPKQDAAQCLPEKYL